jgi:hypothetical protein
MDPIVAFYSGGHDSEGRNLAEILSWDDERLEAVHDYIQWLFPTRQPSGVNPDAPLVSSQTVRAFDTDPILRSRLRDSLERMLSFYGLARQGERIEIDRRRFDARARVWLHPGNHNHLRLTRIMDSLSSLGLLDDARALQRCLTEEVASGDGSGRVSESTRRFWNRIIG